MSSQNKDLDAAPEDISPVWDFSNPDTRQNDSIPELDQRMTKEEVQMMERKDIGGVQKRGYPKSWMVCNLNPRITP